MPFDPMLAIKKENGRAFNLRVVIRICRNMQSPISASLVRRCAIMQRFRKRALSQSDDFVLLCNILRAV